MITRSRSFLSPLLLLFFFASVRAAIEEPAASTDPTTQMEAVRQQVATMFGVDPNAPRKPPSSSRSAKAAAKFLHRLYLKQAGGAQLSDGITVRSSVPVVEESNRSENRENRENSRLRFRIHAMQAGDALIRAEIHFRRRSYRFVSTPPSVYARVSCDACDERGTFLMAAPFSERNPWITFNATEIVKKAVNGGNGWIDVEFVTRSTPLRPSNVLRYYAPFLVVFSKSPQAEEEPSEGTNEAAVGGRRKRSIDAYYRYIPVDENSKPDGMVDEADGKDPVWGHIENFRRTGPRLLQERPTKKPRRPRYNPNDPMLGFGSMPAEEETQTAAPTVGLRAAREDLTVYLLGGENRRSNEQQCAKRDFVIHFNEIGWGEWVIAPKKFEAHYCAGTCTFPLGQEHNPSNHAQLQSIAHQLGLQPGLPPACCAPQRLDSQTLLYYDESGDVVLKNYPKMIVSSCGCA